MSWRDLYCGEAGTGEVGRTLALAGWVARRRDHGGLIFIDLRDHTGVVQLVVNPERSAASAEAAHGIRSEFVVRARGELVRRAADAVNPNIPTGEVELQVDELVVPTRSARSPTTKVSRSRSGSGTATSTCAASACSETCGCPRR